MVSNKFGGGGLRDHGPTPRHRANRLVFLAADQATLGRLDDETRRAMAWEGIVADAKEGKLNIDRNQENQAVKEAKVAADALPKVARECFRWFLCPVQDDPKAERPTIEPFPLATSGESLAAELGRVCRDNELIIEAWAPIHLRALLKDYYWKNGRVAVSVETFWNDSQRYLYLPRLRSFESLTAAVRAGATSQDFFATAQGEAAGKFEGFRFGDGLDQVAPSLLLIEPGAARDYVASQVPPPAPEPVASSSPTSSPSPRPDARHANPAPGSTTPAASQSKKADSFHGSVEVPAAMAKVRFLDIANEIISILAQDPDAELSITVEIAARFPRGASDQVRRGVRENAASLHFKVSDWE